jgi:hypothetical protein
MGLYSPPFSLGIEKNRDENEGGALLHNLKRGCNALVLCSVCCSENNMKNSIDRYKALGCQKYVCVIELIMHKQCAYDGNASWKETSAFWKQE